MKSQLTISLLLLGCLFSGLQSARSQGSGELLDPNDWPRVYTVGQSEVAIYLPQILEWNEFRHLTATAAIGVKLEGSSTATFGAAQIDAATVADFDLGKVRIGQRTIDQFRFPELSEEQADQAEKIVRAVLTPDSPLELPLTAMTAAVDRGSASTRSTAVNFDPPPIFHSDGPAVLVIFLGEPKLAPVNSDDPSLLFAVNTNWDILFDGNSYYLLDNDRWLTTADLKGKSWKVAEDIPQSFHQLPDDENWSDVKAKLFALPGVAESPEVFVSDRPAELILTQGKPQLGPITGTGLFYVVNTESEIFLHASSKTYYFLTAGRWFSASSLEGPWSAATETLPSEFQSIPETHPKSEVLVSVPGTPKADEAVILASIPQTATVDRNTATVSVSYDGNPRFVEIPGSEEVRFATNTSNDVFQLESQYFCCYNGVWFISPAPTGPWVVCDNVPGAIYSIPPESPKYNVTYVHVYDSTPDTVQVGTTSGYEGAYIAKGLVVFGLGMWLGHELADNRYPSPYWYGYGCGAIYRPGHGYCRAGAAHYGPYGGAGFGSSYNPATGTYARSRYAYGPRGAVGVRSAYNPWTNTSAGRVGAATPYGSWGRSAVVRDDEWIRAGHRSNPYGSAGAIQTSKGGAAVGVKRNFGSNAFVGQNKNGDVYVGRDGNIYRKNEGGSWETRHNGGWKGAPDVPRASPYTPGTRPTAAAGRVDPARPAQGLNRPATTPKVTRPAPTVTRSRPSSSNINRSTYTRSTSSTSAQLNRDSFSRERSSSSRSGFSRGGSSGLRRR